MQKIARGLGRGLDTLIPQDFDTSILIDEGERIQKIATDAIIPRRDQPRQHFDETALRDLASSIETHGVLLPLVVTSVGVGMYQIIAGERRWRAAKMINLATLPAIVRTLQELERLEIALVENVQRVDLAPLEQAVSIERLHQQFALPYDEVAKRLGKATSTIVNVVRLLQLPLTAREALERGEITEGHARAILALKNHSENQQSLLEGIIKQGWSVRQAERYVTGVKAGVKDDTAVKQRVSLESPLTKVLSERFHAPVFIRRTARGGKLEIVFKSEKELERLTKLLSQR